jgi:hypothetical protein
VQLTWRVELIPKKPFPRRSISQVVAPAVNAVSGTPYGAALGHLPAPATINFKKSVPPDIPFRAPPRY